MSPISCICSDPYEDVDPAFSGIQPLHAVMLTMAAAAYCGAGGGLLLTGCGLGVGSWVCVRFKPYASLKSRSIHFTCPSLMAALI